MSRSACPFVGDAERPRRRTVRPVVATTHLAPAAAGQAAFHAVQSTAVWFFRVTVVVCLSVAALPLASGFAQTQVPISAQRLVPADAAFYASSRLHREQFEVLANSRAWAELMAMPFTKSLEVAFLEGFAEGDGATPEEMWQELEAFFGEQQLADLLRFLEDIASHEAFIYGGADWVAFTEALGAAAVMTPTDLTYENGQLSDPAQQALIAQAEAFLDENLDQLKVPDVVFGVRVTDRELARKHVELLHAAVTLAMFSGDVPPTLRTAYRRRDVGEAEWITLKLRGNQIPWEQLQGEMGELDPRQQDLMKRVREHFESQELMVGLGMYEDFLLVSLGDSLEHLEQIADADKLTERSEFQKLEPYATQPLTGLYYVAEAMNRAVIPSTAEESLVRAAETFAELAEGQLPHAELFAENLRADAARLGQQLDAIAMPPAAALGFAFLTAEGYEQFDYYWAQAPQAIGNRPLTILSHLDREPFLFTASHVAESAATYEQLGQWLQRVDWYLEEYGPALLEQDGYQAYLGLRQRAVLYLERFDATTKANLLPAIAGGETAWIFDLRNKKEQWVPFAPPAPFELPVPEIGLVCRIRDRAPFMRAMSDYDQLAHEMFAELAIAAGEDFPEELVFPQPTSETWNDAEVYYYPFAELEAFGLDDAFRPNLAVTDELAIYSLSLRHTRRLLEEQPLANAGPYTRLDQPVVSVSGCNFVALVDLLDAWFAYGEQNGVWDDIDLELGEPDFEPVQPQLEGDGEGLGSDEDESANADELSNEEFIESVRTMLAVLRCFRGGRSVTFHEEGTTVRHSQYLFSDIPW